VSIRRIVGLALVVTIVPTISAGCSDDDAAGVRPPAASALPPDVEDDVTRGEEGVDWESVEPATGATTGSAMPERLDFVGAALTGEEGTPFSFATVQLDAASLGALERLRGASVEIRDVSLLAHTAGLRLGGVMALEQPPGPGMRPGGAVGFPPPGVDGLTGGIGFRLDTTVDRPGRTDTQLFLGVVLEEGTRCGAFAGVGVMLADDAGETEVLAFPQGLLLCRTEAELECVSAQMTDRAQSAELLAAVGSDACD
jgi:hypothetical protein